MIGKRPAVRTVGNTNRAVARGAGAAKGPTVATTAKRVKGLADPYGPPGRRHGAGPLAAAGPTGAVDMGHRGMRLGAADAEAATAMAAAASASTAWGRPGSVTNGPAAAYDTVMSAAPAAFGGLPIEPEVSEADVDPAAYAKPARGERGGGAESAPNVC